MKPVHFIFLFHSVLVSFLRVSDGFEDISKDARSTEIELLGDHINAAARDVMLKDSKECDCGEFGLSCNYVDGRKKCACAKGYGRKISNTEEETCTKCECGANGRDCMMLPENKLCECQLGKYKDRILMKPDEECQVCDCGPESISCDFSSLKYGKYKRFCKCKAGYSSERKSSDRDDEYCKLCSCGQHGKCQIKDLDNRSKKECVCDTGYVVFNGTCRRCDCGGSLNCEYDSLSERRKCECKEGYAKKTTSGSRDEYCDKCDCGEFGVTCEFLFSYRKCTCKEGYIANDYEGDLNDYCIKKSWFAGWMIVVIVAAVAFIGIVAAVVVIKMRSSRRY